MERLLNEFIYNLNDFSSKQFILLSIKANITLDYITAIAADFLAYAFLLRQQRKGVKGSCRESVS